MNLVGLQMIAATLALPGFTGAFAEPYLRSFRMQPGEKWATGDASIVGYYVDSNHRYAIAEFVGLILYYLPDPDDSTAYCTGEMLDDLSVMLDPKSSSELIGVVAVLKPRMSRAVSRVGNVIEYEVTTPVVLESVS